jgi:SAM-dependent methyltransferase/MFS family permease
VTTDSAVNGAGSSAATGSAPRWLFTLTILVGSFLLFLVQPMVARMALPKLGGAPAVWNSAMLVYQALLLGGYAWAHWLGRYGQRTQLMLHGGLLVVALSIALLIVAQPVGLANLSPPSDNNVYFFVPILLLASVGPLLFAISAQAPLMQRWFAQSAPGANPYALYAASNLGSFGGLIAYPLLVEPNLNLFSQSWGWGALYVALVALVFACGFAALRVTGGVAKQSETPTAPTSARPPMRRILLWIALSAVPSGLMLSTTTHLTTDIMAMPLMWAIPLGLYLLSFSIAFADNRVLADFFTLLAPPMVLLAGGLSLMSGGGAGVAVAASSLVMLFTVAVSLHARLYRLRPEPDRLTFFYLIMAVGGAIGGLFCALIAPLVFDWAYEHPLLVIAAALLLPLPALIPLAEWLKLDKQWQRIVAMFLALIALLIGWWMTKNWVGLDADGDMLMAIAGMVAVGLLAIGWRFPFIVTLLALMVGMGGLLTIQTSLDGLRTRSYFGIYTVRTNPVLETRTLAHGTTLHGTQITTDGLEETATSYYGPSSGVGLAFQRAGQLYGNNAAIGVVGLGTGTLACYRVPGQRWTIFEIDPAMERIARNPDNFSFLADCAPNVPIVIGDARIRLREVPAGSLDLLAIDAFSSDAIPLHLLTREAFEVYARALQPQGIALVHISNRYVDLEPVLRAFEEQGGWHALVRDDVPDSADMLLSRTGSIWVAMARNRDALDRLAIATEAVPDGRGLWRPLSDAREPRLWTDDYASVLPLLSLPEFNR